MKGPIVESSIVVIRWIARLWSAASVAFVPFMAEGELLSPYATAPVSLRDLVGLFFFPFGVCAGLILAWRCEGLRGTIAVASLLAFYAALRIMDGRFSSGPYLALIGALEILFLLSRAINVATGRASPG